MTEEGLDPCEHVGNRLLEFGVVRRDLECRVGQKAAFAFVDEAHKEIAPG